ncbi:MAG: bifunctional (p)ppGpp synthetase/guanosine-3',5'-bis(diphosphate) 3'-pyrophosphohydrolase [Gammaproteobacteria bacterium]|nr:bifunctional (p)ppGpp synthetase/guanosine-3',5'-bis(diphosphate) 3'-pyrophosphohydrolase [Gammaproteobacteria bacterium]
MDDVVALLCHKESNSANCDDIRRAVRYFWPYRYENLDLPGGLNAAVSLKHLGVDHDTIVSSILSCYALKDVISLEQIAHEFGNNVAVLVKSVRWMNALNESVDDVISDQKQAEYLRRMVLAVVEDVRAVLIKLVFRLERLKRLVKREHSLTQQSIAKETLSLYAPLANRLGIGQIKWEMEDLAFRCLNPQAYQRIACALEEKRKDREDYIHSFVKELKKSLRKEKVRDFEVFGRPKHIFSIWKKMYKKQIQFEDLFDVRAVRVVVNRATDCYKVLGVVHSNWKHIPSEFDDYIANPKNNGYQSLHTAVIGMGGKAVEVQIRTRAMNEHAEYGVAAHWRYKEGQTEDSQFQKTINALRQMLETTSVEDKSSADVLSTELFSDRVFARTPKGKIFELPQGSTVLDFAYYVHTDIGHRCRGAKVDGRIVPLTFELKSGSEVEILTTREPRPSRDWLNSNLGYLQTSRARSKVRNWFKIQDHTQHIHDGKVICDRELKRLNATHIGIESVSKKLKLDNTNELYASLGRNDVSNAQLVSAVVSLLNERRAGGGKPAQSKRREKLAEAAGDSEVIVRGVGNLLTQRASCCKPEVNDPIIGYITRGKGVSVHRRDCTNILNLDPSEAVRLIEVSWGAEKAPTLSVVILIQAYDRYGLMRDISAVMANHDVYITSIHTESNRDEQTADMSFKVDVQDINQLILVMDKLRQLPNVIEVSRAE